MFPLYLQTRKLAEQNLSMYQRARKHRFIYELHGAISQKMAAVVTTDLIASSPTYYHFMRNTADIFTVTDVGNVKNN
jgi:hypothetical protein